MEEELLLKLGKEAQGPGCRGPSHGLPDISDTVSVVGKPLALGSAIRCSGAPGVGARRGLSSRNSIPFPRESPGVRCAGFGHLAAALAGMLFPGLQLGLGA